MLPPITAVTADLAYVRLHGRNAATWNARVRVGRQALRVSLHREELGEWVEPVRQLQEQTATTYVMFNNCYADYAPRNAKQMMSLFDAAAGAGRPRSSLPEAPRGLLPKKGAAPREGRRPEKPSFLTQKRSGVTRRPGPRSRPAETQTFGRFFIASLILSSG